jgi:hypothetical protein
MHNRPKEASNRHMTGMVMQRICEVLKLLSTFVDCTINEGITIVHMFWEKHAADKLFQPIDFVSASEQEESNNIERAISGLHSSNASGASLQVQKRIHEWVFFCTYPPGASLQRYKYASINRLFLIPGAYLSRYKYASINGLFLVVIPRARRPRYT